MPAILFTVTLTSTHAAPLTKESIEEAGSSLMAAGWNMVHTFMRLVQLKKFNYVVEMVPYSHQLDYIYKFYKVHFSALSLLFTLPGDVQILGDLALTISSPHITLTCISTGGPAIYHCHLDQRLHHCHPRNPDYVE